jgi:hypothetical protein
MDATNVKTTRPRADGTPHRPIISTGRWGSRTSAPRLVSFGWTAISPAATRR